MRWPSCRRNRAWTLDVIGDGPKREAYQAQAAELGIDARIRFLGYQPKSAIVAACSRPIYSSWPAYGTIALRAA